MVAGFQIGLRIPLNIDHVRDERTPAHVERRLYALPHARTNAVFDDEAIHHDLDIVRFVALQLHAFLVGAHLSVDAEALEALAGRLLKELAVVALAALYDRCQNHETGAIGEVQDAVDDLVIALLAHLVARLVRVGGGGASVEQAQKVIHLGDGAHGGARVAAHGFLLDGDHRRESVDVIHVGALHHLQKLTCVGTQALHVAALALGIDGIERQTGLARAR